MSERNGFMLLIMLCLGAVLAGIFGARCTVETRWTEAVSSRDEIISNLHREVEIMQTKFDICMNSKGPVDP